MLQITLVKKIKSDGTPCRKCRDVLERLEKDRLDHRIERVVIADERDPESEGMRLANKYQVEQAPFFLVCRDGVTEVYSSYLKLKREVLHLQNHSSDEALELLQQNPDLDFI